jgi:hypothetical protein
MAQPTNDADSTYRHEIGKVAQRWKMGTYRRLWHITHAAWRRKNRGRRTRSSQPSAGKGIN